MKTLYNFLSQDIIDLAHQEVNQYKIEPIWMSSQNFWQDVLQEGSVVGNVSQTFTSPHLTKLIADAIEPHVPQYKRLVVQHYLWHPLSGINMHNDGGARIFGATIYLTPKWNINWGGLFIYVDGDNLQTLFPTYNSFNINDNKTNHMVTTISPLAPYPRYTLQIWGEGE